MDLDHTDVTLQDASSNILGTAICSNLTNERVYLSAVRMNGAADISLLDRITDGNGYVSVTPRIQEASKRALIFDTGLNSLFNTNDSLIPVRTQVAGTSTSGTITLTANPGEDFNCDNNDILIVDSTSTQHPVVSKATSLNNSQLDINIADTSSLTVTVYFNKRLIGSSGGTDPYNKVIRTPYVKVNYTAATSKYSLGFPDVYKILSIVDSNGEDYSNSFRLKTNQKDTYYDLSYIEYIEGRPKPGNGVLTIQMSVFEASNSTGEYFFTINSYPNTLERYEIPTYVSSSGREFNLRECFDFRPHVNKDTSADYNNASAGSAPTLTTPVGSNTIAFNNLGVPLLPAASQAITTDLSLIHI